MRILWGVVRAPHTAYGFVLTEEIGIVWLAGKPQVNVYLHRLSIEAGFPFEWPNRLVMGTKVRYGFGPVAFAWSYNA